MADNKIYRKKLTGSGVGICFLTGLAATLACCAAAGDFLAAAIYDQFYTSHVYPMYRNPADQISHYGGAAVTAVFAVIMFVWALSAAKSKRLGREFGIMGVFMGAALCLMPGLELFSQLSSGFADTYFGTGYDSDVFQGVTELARSGLPIASGALLFLAGIAALARIGNEDFAVEAPGTVKKNTDLRETVTTKPDSSEFSDPCSFGSKAAEQTAEIETSIAENSKSEDEKPAHKEPPTREEGSAKKSAIKLCFKCGELIGDGELFCAYCGQKM